MCPSPDSPAPGTRASRKAKTRAAILDAARHRFRRDGFEATTIRDIALAAGVGVGTVHAHFSDKQVLLLACFDAQVAQAVALGFGTIDSEASLLDQLAHLARVLYAAYARDVPLSRVMVQASLWPPEGAPPDTLLMEFLGGVAGVFAQALDRGEIERLPEDGLLAAQGFFSAYLAALIGGLSGGLGPLQDDALVDVQVGLLRRLLSVQLVGLGGPVALLSPTPEVCP